MIFVKNKIVFLSTKGSTLKYIVIKISTSPLPMLPFFHNFLISLTDLIQNSY